MNRIKNKNDAFDDWTNLKKTGRLTQILR